MKVSEEERYSKDYHDPEKRSIANAIQIEFADGSKTDKVEVEYPLGHRRRRTEAIPEIVKKFKHNMGTHYTHRQLHSILDVSLDATKFAKLTVPEFMQLLVKN